MNNKTLYFFRKEIEKQAGEKQALAAFGALGVQSLGQMGMQLGSGATKLLSKAPRSVRSTFQPAVNKLSGSSANLVTSAGNKRQLLNQAGDVGMDLLF